ncbi:GNAT family N-acetyltransferase [Vibrio hepatarius]|uniref:GNAT family N-acetyltransferase n=1 Tax=Vibrio hepatarius TaxID=171383 RepID=UPI001C083967|nr:GNAT family N-acetyltransferase [Vibrio hepatarius]MBU2898133.1 GNAT family N-acetyltransferase [Vibrio hepatarius]
MQVRLLENGPDYVKALEVLLQLRNNYNLDTLSAQVQKQQQNGFQVAYVKLRDEVIAVAGFCIGEKLAWGKYMYIDDLITNSAYRSRGAGKILLDWLKEHARENGCVQLHLDSGVQRYPAHRFYLCNGFNIASHHFSLLEL